MISRLRQFLFMGQPISASCDHEHSKTDGSAMAKARVHCHSRLHDRICSCCSAPSVCVLRVFLSFWGARCGHMHAPTWPSAEKLSSRRALGSALPSARPWAASRVTLDHGVRGTRATSQPKRACLGESGRLPATPGPPPNVLVGESCTRSESFSEHLGTSRGQKVPLRVRIAPHHPLSFADSARKFWTQNPEVTWTRGFWGGSIAPEPFWLTQSIRWGKISLPHTQRQL